MGAAARVDFNRLAHWRLLPVLSEAEVEALTGLSRSTLARLRADGRLETADLGVAGVHYRTASVARWLGEPQSEQQAETPAPKASRRARRDADLLLRRRTG